MVHRIRLRVLSHLARGSLLLAIVGAFIAVPDMASAAPTRAQGTAQSTPVEGAPWSSPAYPVECRESSGQISCTPVSPAEVKPQKCYVDVLFSGSTATVCTTYDAHGSAIQSAGGREVSVGYGCSAGDLVCVTFENAGRGMALATMGMMFTVAENMRFDTSTALWNAAAGEWSFWAWAVLAVVFIAMVWAVTQAVTSGDRSEVAGALVRSFIAFPATALTLWLTGHVLNAVDDLTWFVLNRDGPGALFGTLQRVMWAGGQANYFFGFVIHGLLFIGLLLMMLVFAFRNIALAALVAVGPIAWMVFPVRSIGPQWVVRYLSALAVLLLTAPLTVGFMTLIVNGLASVRTIWDPQAWPLLVGLVLVAFAPFAVFGLFNFVGSVAADGVGSAIASRAGRGVSGAAARAASIPSRLGAMASGIASPSRGAAARGAAGAAGRVAGAPRAAGSMVGARSPSPNTQHPSPGTGASTARTTPATTSGAAGQAPGGSPTATPRSSERKS
jgi:hypothetical protein